MARPPRHDVPGSWHHVGNRGIAHRVMFNTKADVRYFLAMLAWQVHAGRIRVIAYCILTNHFHLLLESLVGELSGVMHDVMTAYVRRFNPREPRDGSLCKDRFWSRPLTSEAYRRAVVQYIDRNAPEARLACSSADYPFGSAFHYRSARRPPWLSTEWIDRWMRPPPEGGSTRARNVSLDEDDLELVELRMRQPPSSDDPLDELRDAEPPAIRAWFEKQALLADGTRRRVALVGPRRIQDVVAAAKREGGEWLVAAAWGCRVSAWDVCTAGMLRELAALTAVEIAGIVDASRSTLCRRIEQHERCTREDAAYATRLGALVAACLARPRGT